MLFKVLCKYSTIYACVIILLNLMVIYSLKIKCLIFDCAIYILRECMYIFINVSRIAQ